MKSRGGLGREGREPHLSSSLAFIFSRSFLLRTASHYLNAWNRLQPNALFFFFFFQVISRHVELQGKSYPLEQQQQVIAYNTMFE